jgi:hypothetical protein
MSAPRRYTPFALDSDEAAKAPKHELIPMTAMAKTEKSPSPRPSSTAPMRVHAQRLPAKNKALVMTSGHQRSQNTSTGRENVLASRIPLLPRGLGLPIQEPFSFPGPAPAAAIALRVSSATFATGVHRQRHGCTSIGGTPHDPTLSLRRQRARLGKLPFETTPSSLRHARASVHAGRREADGEASRRRIDALSRLPLTRL